MLTGLVIAPVYLQLWDHHLLSVWFTSCHGIADSAWTALGLTLKTNELYTQHSVMVCVFCYILGQPSRSRCFALSGMEVVLLPMAKMSQLHQLCVKTSHAKKLKQLKRWETGLSNMCFVAMLVDCGFLLTANTLNS